MPSDVNICNLALAHLGDTATISTINPPDGSAQAGHCSRFYPVARDVLLEFHSWSFATRRIQLSLLTTTVSTWRYVYALPVDNINIMSVIAADAADDYAVRLNQTAENNFYPGIQPQAGVNTPQPYHLETLQNGTPVLMTNCQNAVLRYTARVTDANQFSPLFVMTLSWYLASVLAGPIIKGDAGAAEGKRCLEMFYKHLVEATQSDAVQREIKPQHFVPWMSGR